MKYSPTSDFLYRSKNCTPQTTYPYAITHINYTTQAIYSESTIFSWQGLKKYVRFHHIALLQLLCKFLGKSHVNTKFCFHHCIPKIKDFFRTCL